MDTRSIDIYQTNLLLASLVSRLLVGRVYEATSLPLTLAPIFLTPSTPPLLLLLTPSF